ncbi:MAG: SRPBCC domain-containing protein [Tessaracoccus sp.]
MDAEQVKRGNLTPVDAPDAGTGSLDDAVVAEVTVNRAAPETFALFLDTLGDWWPLRDYSLAPDVVAIEVERRLGGHVIEVHGDGSRATWGTLVTWEPPHRFAMDWYITPGLERTIVTVTFRSLGSRLTKVTLVHSGWQAVDPALLPARHGYTEGWAKILRCFARSVGSGE